MSHPGCDRLWIDGSGIRRRALSDIPHWRNIRRFVANPDDTLEGLLNEPNDDNDDTFLAYGANQLVRIDPISAALPEKPANNGVNQSDCLGYGSFPTCTLRLYRIQKPIGRSGLNSMSWSLQATFGKATRAELRRTIGRRRLRCHCRLKSRHTGCGAGRHLAHKLLGSAPLSGLWKFAQSLFPSPAVQRDDCPADSKKITIKIATYLRLFSLQQKGRRVKVVYWTSNRID